MEQSPLLKRTKDIAAMLPYWEKVGAIIEGLEAVRNEGDVFLPKFPNEGSDDYDFRLTTSKLTNVYRDVLEGLATKPFEEEVSLIGKKIPQEIVDFSEDVDGSGNNLTVFAALTFFNGINNAIDWIFIDYPKVNADRPLTVAEARRLNIKPFWTHILAKNVLEVRTETVGSKEVLTYIRVFEPATNDTPDRVRVFERDENGTVTWQLFERNDEAKKVEDQFVEIENGKLSIDVIPFVPFTTGRRDGRSFKFFPVMRDAVDLQVTLYQNESALEYIKTLACYPMLAANGMKPQKQADGKTPEKIGVGPMRVLYGVPDGAGNHGEWKFIEPNANSMEFLQKNIDKTKQDLRELGRQPLTALSTQLTTVTTSIAAGKARSAVSAWALGLKDALENAFLITAKWMRIDYQPEVNVYTGFDNVLDNGTDLDALISMRSSGDLSAETLWFEMKRRKVLSPEFNYENEVERILNETPSDGIDSPVISDNTDTVVNPPE